MSEIKYTKEMLDGYSVEENIKLIEDEGSPGVEGLLDELYTVPGLRKYAEGRKINLKGRDKKGDIVVTIREWFESLAGLSTPDSEEEGSDAQNAEPTEQRDDSGADLDEDEDEDESYNAVDLTEVPLEDLANVVSALVSDIQQITNIINSHANHFSQEIGQVRAAMAVMQKKLNVKEKDATLHGHIDDLQ